MLKLTKISLIFFFFLNTFGYAKPLNKKITFICDKDIQKKNINISSENYQFFENFETATDFTKYTFKYVENDKFEFIKEYLNYILFSKEPSQIYLSNIHEDMEDIIVVKIPIYHLNIPNLTEKHLNIKISNIIHFNRITLSALNSNYFKIFNLITLQYELNEDIKHFSNSSENLNLHVYKKTGSNMKINFFIKKKFLKKLQTSKLNFKNVKTINANYLILEPYNIIVFFEIKKNLLEINIKQIIDNYFGVKTQMINVNKLIRFKDIKCIEKNE